MKVLVAYAGKTGTTKKCVDYMKMISTDEVVLYDTKSTDIINIEDYDIVIMGGSIRIGVMDNSLRKFAKDYDFRDKHIGLFVICGATENKDKYLRTNFPSIVSIAAESCFGGEFAITKVKGLEKVIIKRAIKESEKKKKPLPQIDYQDIKDFIEKLYFDFYAKENGQVTEKVTEKVSEKVAEEVIPKDNVNIETDEIDLDSFADMD